LLLVACSNTSSSPDTLPMKDAAVDGKTRDLVVDQIPVADLTATADRAVWYGAQFLTSAHPGWKRSDCLSASCHPYASSDKLPVYKCATCHGGNGACNPNGASSGKKDHTASSTCTSSGCHDTAIVHPSATTYTQDVQCVTCHFAKRGGTPDC
jgi:hypothetical protein